MKRTIGILAILLGAWGGAWLLSIFPSGSAYKFPAFLTGLMVAGYGVMQVIDDL